MGGVTHLLLLLWVGVTVSTAVDLQKRIIGGKKCGKKERLYHVKLVDDNNNFVCGGSLITDQWVLTAAHCLPKARKAVVRVHPSKNKKGQTPKRSVIYPDENGIHDIMLWKLPKSTGLVPVNLPGNNCPRPRIKKVQIAGHGSSVPCDRCGPHGKRTDDLQCADINVIDCKPFSSSSEFIKPDDRVFCGDTTTVPKVDACYGDSGGGVVHNGVIYGVIASGGHDACTRPVKFMDVCAYMDWITETITK